MKKLAVLLSVFALANLLAFSALAEDQTITTGTGTVNLTGAIAGATAYTVSIPANTNLNDFSGYASATSIGNVELTDFSSNESTKVTVTAAGDDNSQLARQTGTEKITFVLGFNGTGSKEFVESDIGTTQVPVNIQVPAANLTDKPAGTYTGSITFTIAAS
jgi:hypothetical protein